MPLREAQSANAWFLGIVATWRVLLLWFFLKRVAQLRGVAIFVACLLPLTLIVVSLMALNLEHVVFNIMAGNDPSTRSANDGAYGVLFLLTMLSMLAAPPLAVAYIVLVIDAWRKAKPYAAGATQPDDDAGSPR